MAMTKYVVGFMFDLKHYGVLLIQKQKPAWQKGKINGIGGKVEEGETSLQAMRREFKEEVGIDHVFFAAFDKFCQHKISLHLSDFLKHKYYT